MPYSSPDPTPSATLNPSPTQRTNAGFLLRHTAHFIALGFGSGLARRAPGTVGTLWAWLAFAAIEYVWTPSAAHWGLLITAALLIGWWASTVTIARLRVADPSAVVIDEIAAFWLVLWLVTPAGFWAQAWAFALFRFFDAVKPAPVAWADQQFKGLGWRGGFGVMFDDLVAALCTLVVIALGRAI